MKDYGQEKEKGKKGEKIKKDEEQEGRKDKKGKKGYKGGEYLAMFSDEIEVDEGINEFDNFSSTVVIITLLVVALMSTIIYKKYVKDFMGMGKY